ncbi:MAG: PQQ-dependent sugar dehydrogenase [Thermoleophilaceae bacterium]|nr:PQQ-dependent sugar dehydrogenase [Thermoleophilaceae bacterium]
MALLALPAQALAAPRLERVGSFDQPLYVTAPAGDTKNFYVVEQEGRIWRVTGTRKRLFVDLRRSVQAGGERGLLGLAMSSARRYYVYFTDSTGDIRVQERGRRTRDLLRVRHRKFENHNGGQLSFGPDGKLYAGIGDGGGGGDPDRNGQNRGTFLGKIVRIDPRTRRTSIYAYGLRNPYRFSFDRQTGDLHIGDVGQNEVEEVDYLKAGTPAGTNFGWNVFEGSRRFGSGDAPGHVPPVLERTHSGDGVCSITSGYVVRDPALTSLAGRYLHGDFCAPSIRSMQAGGGDDRETGLRVSQLSSFGEDGRGRVYVTSLGGSVYRLAEG